MVNSKNMQTLSKTKKLKDVRSIIEDIYCNGNFKKYKISTPYIVYEIKSCYNSIVNGNYSLTICDDVKTFYERRGFNIVPDGIGWKISL